MVNWITQKSRLSAHQNILFMVRELNCYKEITFEFLTITKKKNIQCNFKIGIKTYKERKRSIAKSLVSMKMCFMWLVITEMKIIVQSDAITYQNNYNWKQKQNNNDSLRWKFSYTAGESINQYSPWNLFTVHTKTKHVHTVWPSSSIARHVSNGMMCIYRWKNIYVCTCS